MAPAFSKLARPRAASPCAAVGPIAASGARSRWRRLSLALIMLETEKTTNQMLRVLNVWQRMVGAYRIIGRFTPLIISQVEQCRVLRSDRRRSRCLQPLAQPLAGTSHCVRDRPLPTRAFVAGAPTSGRPEFCDCPVGILWECSCCRTRWGLCYRHGERWEQCFICGWSACSVSDIGDVDDCDDLPTRCQHIVNLPGPSIVCGGVDHLCAIPEERRAPLLCRRRLDFMVYHYE